MGTIFLVVKLLLYLKVTEVAHDIQVQVARYMQDMGFVNSYDTWHGKILQEIVHSHTAFKKRMILIKTGELQLYLFLIRQDQPTST